MDRCDVLMVAFNFASLFVWLFHYDFKNSSEETSSWPALVSGLLYAAALLTKQTAWPLGVVLFLVSAHQHRWKRCTVFLLASGITVLGSFFVLQKITHGLFAYHTLFGCRGVLDLQNLWLIIKGSWLRECGPLFILALVAFQWARPQNRILQTLLLIQTVNLLTMGRAQSAENYYLEFYLLLVLWVGECFGKSDVDLNFKTWLTAGLVLWVSTSLLLLPRPRVPQPQEIEAKKQAASVLTGQGPALLLDTDLALMSGRHVWYQPFPFMLLYQMGIWNAETLVRELNQGQVEWVETYSTHNRERFPPPVLKAIEENYQPVLQAWGRVFWRPKRTQAKGNDKPLAPFPPTQRH